MPAPDSPPSAFITGATGFIGGALAEYLHRRGWQVTAGVRPASAGKLPAGSPFRVVAAPLEAVPPAALRGQVVFHAAAIRNRWGTPPERYHQVNVEGTRALLQAAAEGGARRFVYLSSVGVYGWPGILEIDERTPLDDTPAATPYHRSKIAAERVVRAFSEQVETVIVRPTITCGPGDRDGMLTRLIALLQAGRFLPVGRGENTIHLTDIADLCAGLALAGRRPAAAGETFIISGARPVQVRILLETLARLLGKRLPPVCIPAPLALTAGWALAVLYRRLRLPGEPFITPEKVRTLTAPRSFSHAKAARLLGYRPQVPLEESLRRTLRWVQAYPSTP